MEFPVTNLYELDSRVFQVRIPFNMQMTKKTMTSFENGSSLKTFLGKVFPAKTNELNGHSMTSI